MEAHKRNRNPEFKPKYKGVNWSEYEKNLKNRGNICLWISKDVIRKWKSYQGALNTSGFGSARRR